MENNQSPVAPKVERRRPWNKGKLIGPKPPLRPSQVWAIRTRLQMQERKRDLALFNLAIDSKLRGCDVVAIRVEDVVPGGYALDRATIRQKKTGRPVRFELTDQTRSAINEVDRQEAGSSSLLWAESFARIDNQAICPSCQRLGGEYRPRSAPVRDAFAAPNESSPHLSPDWKPPCCAITSWAQQNRKHGAVSRDRDRRRHRNRCEG